MQGKNVCNFILLLCISVNKLRENAVFFTLPKLYYTEVKSITRLLITKM